MPIPVERELAGQLCGAAVVVGQERFGARGRPLHRLAESLRGEHRDAVFRIGIRADPEAAAHVLGADHDSLRGNAGDAARASAHERKALRAHIQIVLVGLRVVCGKTGLGLHRVSNHALAVQNDARDMSGPRKGCVGLRLIAVLVVETEVVGNLRVELFGARCKRGLRVDRNREIAVSDLDFLGGILCGERRLRHDEGDFLADEAHASIGEPIAVRNLDGRAAAARVARELRRGFEAGLGRIGAREHCDHAGRRLRSRGVDRDDFRMRPVGAQERAVELSGKIPVGRIFSLSRDQPQILAPALETRTHSSASGLIQKCTREPRGTDPQRIDLGNSKPDYQATRAGKLRATPGVHMVTRFRPAALAL